MAKPYVHAVSSARKFGGNPEAYLPIHDFMDSSKSALPDNRHRALTHTSWFLSTVLERVFGHNITVTLEDGRERLVSVRDIGEQHILEDFGGHYIPTAQDFLQEMEIKHWMQGGKTGVPPSYQKIANTVVRKRISMDKD